MQRHKKETDRFYSGINFLKSSEIRKTRKVFLFDEINEVTSQETIEALLDLDMDKKKRPITLYLSSPGGECGYGFAIVDVIERLNCPIKVIALGDVCSMAPLIFVACDERIISKHAFIMLHPASAGAEDYIAFVRERIKNAESVEKMYDKYFLERTNIPKKFYNRAKTKEMWLSADDAVKYGIAHKIF